mmetsp:Transcript_17816/g.41104  ORF Transcript_17816/g.41104 Transcript_17816/m.41104 type:complete len:231 (+) Transcript_17816:149-841(+)
MIYMKKWRAPCSAIGISLSHRSIFIRMNGSNTFVATGIARYGTVLGIRFSHINLRASLRRAFPNPITAQIVGSESDGEVILTLIRPEKSNHVIKSGCIFFGNIVCSERVHDDARIRVKCSHFHRTPRRNDSILEADPVEAGDIAVGTLAKYQLTRNALVSVLDVPAEHRCPFEGLPPFLLRVPQVHRNHGRSLRVSKNRGKGTLLLNDLVQKGERFIANVGFKRSYIREP